MTTKEKVTLAVVLTVRSKVVNWHQITRDVLSLSRLAGSAQTLAVRECNEGATKGTPIKRMRLQMAINRTVEDYGLRCEIGGDPRGYVTRLFALKGTPALPGNTWGGQEDGYGI